MKATATNKMKVDGDINRTTDEKMRTAKAEMMLTQHDDVERQKNMTIQL